MQPWAGDVRRCARKVRRLCLALPFPESKVKLKVGRGKVGCRREGSMVGENAASQAENFPLQGLADPPWLSLPVQRTLGNPRCLPWKSPPPPHQVQIWPDLHPISPLSLPGQGSASGYHFLSIYYMPGTALSTSHALIPTLQVRKLRHSELK